jgi:hypothetical protein
MTLEIAEALLSKDPTCKLRGTMLQITTVFIAEIYRDGMHGLQLAFLFDALDGRGPYLLVREVVLNPETEIEKIVESHFPDIDTEALEPIFKLRSLKKLIKLVINAILYATSADVEIENRTRPAAEKPDKSKVSGAVDRKLLRREEVFFLPGKITISRLREMQKVERSPSGRHLMTRFMVRGHWRKPNPSWNEQHLRWIKPYWKGPDLAAIIEREYRLKP